MIFLQPHTAWAIYRAHLVQTLARPMMQMILFFQPLVLTVIVVILGRHSGKSDVNTWLLTAGGLSGLWSTLVFSTVGDINRERWAGTLAPIMGTPTSIFNVMGWKLVANVTLGLLAFFLSVAAMYLMGYAVLNGVNVLHFILSLTVLVAATSAFAMTLSSLFFISRNTAVMQNFLEFPLMMLSGIAFPIDSFPVILKAVAALLPMYWGAEALRATLPDGNPADLTWSLGCAALSGVIYQGLGYILFTRIERLVRQNGTLDIY